LENEFILRWIAKRDEKRILDINTTFRRQSKEGYLPRRGLCQYDGIRTESFFVVVTKEINREERLKAKWKQKGSY
jgi:hypothetical protein